MRNKLGHQFTSERPAIVMLLALILMATVTASTIAISVIINRTITQARNLDNFILASLAADSGIERGLAVIKTGRSTGLGYLTTVGETAIGSTPLNGLSDAATVSVTGAEDAQPISVDELPNGKTVQIDLLGYGTNTAPHRLSLQAACPTNGCGALLEVTWTLIDKTAGTGFGNRIVLQESGGNSYSGSGQNINLSDVKNNQSDKVESFTGGSLLGYRIQLRAVNGDLTNVIASPCDDETAPCSSNAIVPSRILLTSTGQAGSSNNRVQSLKTARVFWQPPVSGLLRYVVFSEDNIIP